MKHEWVFIGDKSQWRYCSYIHGFVPRIQKEVPVQQLRQWLAGRQGGGRYVTSWYRKARSWLALSIAWISSAPVFCGTLWALGYLQDEVIWKPSKLTLEKCMKEKDSPSNPGASDEVPGLPLGVVSRWYGGFRDLRRAGNDGSCISLGSRLTLASLLWERVLPVADLLWDTRKDWAILY